MLMLVAVLTAALLAAAAGERVHRSEILPEWVVGPAGAVNSIYREPDFNGHPLGPPPPPGAKLTASPSTIDSGDNVTVAWSGVPNPTDEDWIGVYFVNTNETSYLDYQWASAAPSYMTGSGSVVFQLLNIRQDYIFRYFQQDDSYILAATSNVVSFNNPNEPTQGHIAVTGDATEMRVMWVTNSSAETPVVEFGVTPDLGSLASGTSTTYYGSSMCAAPATLAR